MPILTEETHKIVVERATEDTTPSGFGALEETTDGAAYTAQDNAQPSGSTQPDANEQALLVARALNGDANAFEDIVNHYGSLMLRTALMIVGDRDIAEDVVQDAFIQAWHHLPDLREANALRPWLMRIVVNQCISFKRRLARTTAFVRQALSDQETNIMAQVADDHKGRQERDWDLAHSIESLPMKQRLVIVLHYYNGMTLPEMSQALNMSENTLKKRIQAALANLRRMLGNAEFEEGIVVQRARHSLAPSPSLA